MKSVSIYNAAYVLYEDGKIWSNLSRKFLVPSFASRSAKYVCFCLSNDKKQKTVYLHRLLAEHFIPNPDNLPCVNHIDGNTRNNALENLEWCTFSENTRHAYKTGLMPSRECECGEKMHVNKNLCDRCREKHKEQKKIQRRIKQRGAELESLKAKCRTQKDVEFLRYWQQGASITEIGKKCGCSYQAVQDRYNTLKNR